MILGSFSGSNAGDVAVLCRIVEELELRFPKSTFYVPTTVPSWIQNSKLFQEYNVQPVSMRRRHLAHGYLSFQTLKAVMKCDAIFTTANMFFDRNLLNPWNNFIFSLLPILVLYRAMRRTGRVIAVAVGMTPPSSVIGGIILRRVLELHDLVTVRDDNSAALVTTLSKHIRLRGRYPDVVIGRQPVITVPKTLPAEEVPQHRIGINLSSYFMGELIRPTDKIRSGWLKFFARLITVLSKRWSYETTIILTSGTDEAMAIEMSQMLDHPIGVYGPSAHNHVELQSMIAELDAYLSMRMHGAIFAFSSRVPCLGLCFTDKLRHFYSDYDLTPYRIDLCPNDYAVDSVFEDVLEKTVACARLSSPKREVLRSKMVQCTALQRKLFDGIAAFIQEPTHADLPRRCD